jgi:NADH:ubiquinone oxidoreductase subunit H
VYATSGVPWSGVILFFVMLFSFQAFVQRVPFDIAEAETELMEGPLVEYSGPKLALFKYAQMARLVIHSALFVNLFFPGQHRLPAGWLCFWVKVFAPCCCHAGRGHARRYRIDQAIRYFASLLAVAVVAPCSLVMDSEDSMPCPS